MRIIGFNLTKISGDRKEEAEGKIKVNQNIDIRNIIEDEVPISKDKALKISFVFSVTYTEDFAKIEFEGNLLILPEKHELKSFLDKWEEKKIPDESRNILFNFIMGKCNVKALDLEDQLNLPLHIPLPRLAFDKKE